MNITSLVYAGLYYTNILGMYASNLNIDCKYFDYNTEIDDTGTIPCFYLFVDGSNVENSVSIYSAPNGIYYSNIYCPSGDNSCNFVGTTDSSSVSSSYAYLRFYAIEGWNDVTARCSGSVAYDTTYYFYFDCLYGAIIYCTEDYSNYCQYGVNQSDTSNWICSNGDNTCKTFKLPSPAPTEVPTMPTIGPSMFPSDVPTRNPTKFMPTILPTMLPTLRPTSNPVFEVNIDATTTIPTVTSETTGIDGVGIDSNGTNIIATTQLNDDGSNSDSDGNGSGSEEETSRSGNGIQLDDATS